MRNSNKRPVLTSPWKIGMFVALMLVVTGFGSGYYLVNVYNIKFTWLGVAGSKWGIDSWKFFTEMYPLVAGVVLISLFAYFIIASSVRRYKFYLSSGQDYRKMISLADSIDDLTNPAQIARLSSYPELQSVLRNYGDQIREISEEMGRRENESKSVDLEMEINSLIAGNELQETLAEGKWWAPIARKVAGGFSTKNEELNEAGKQLEEAKKQSETLRRIAGQTALSFGRITESLGGSNEDIMEIVRAIESLNRAVREIGITSSADRGKPAGDGPRSAGADMKGLLDILRDSGKKLHEFSEENNGLALNMALMAARGRFSEQDLAMFAEAVRSTAERFNKLGTRMTDVTGKISENLRSAADSRAGGAAIGNAGMVESLAGISRTIELRSQKLQEKLTALGKELESLNDGLHGVMTGGSVRAAAQAPEAPPAITAKAVAGDKGILVNFGDGVENRTHERAHKDDRLVLDRSNIWQASDVADDRERQDDSGGNGLPVEDEQETGGSGAHSGIEEMEISFGHFDKADGLSGGGTDVAAGGQTEERAQSGPRSGEDWMEMPGHRWVKIDVEEPSGIDSSAEPVSGGGAGENDPMIIADELFGAAGDNGDGALSGGFVAEVKENLMNMAGAGGGSGTMSGIRGGQQAGDHDDEPVYDLFELGAVEYEQKAPTRG